MFTERGCFVIVVIGRSQAAHIECAIRMYSFRSVRVCVYTDRGMFSCFPAAGKAKKDSPAEMDRNNRKRKRSDGCVMPSLTFNLFVRAESAVGRGGGGIDYSLLLLLPPLCRVWSAH